MINERINTFLQNNKTTDHILTLKLIINKYVHDGKRMLYAYFVDFKLTF